MDDPTRPLGKLDLLETLPAASGDPTDPGPAPDRLAFGTRLGRYLVLSTLGSGGMGVVYAAYDPVLDRRIALKLLRESDGGGASAGRARMQREAQALARLQHPNIITVHDVGELAGTMFIAMELVDGATLRDWQKARPWREVLAAYTTAARGLAAAHAAGLVHRDFKPDNVLVGLDGRVRVTDFGLARRAGELPLAPAHDDAAITSASAFDSNLTAAGTVMGTLAYMAPEQLDGLPVDERSDQCSWCIAAWEALYGAQPFITGNAMVRSAAMKTDLPRPPAKSAIPRAVQRVLARGLHPEAAQRWPSMTALVDALDHATSNRRRALGAGALALACAGTAVFVLGRSSGEARVDCATAGDAYASAWTPAQRDALAHAFATTNAAFAADAARAVDRAASAWRDRAVHLAVSSCEATHVHGTQSAAALDLRGACLDRARDHLALALGGLVEHPSAKAVERAPALALPDLDACEDAVALAGATPPPRDPTTRAAIADLEHELDAIDRELDGATSIEREQQLATRARAKLDAATRLGWRPIAMRARLLLSSITFELGQAKPTRDVLVAAAADAAASNDPDALVDAYLELAHADARLGTDYTLADGWLALASGTLARLGARPAKQRRLARLHGLVAERSGDDNQAREAFGEALALARLQGGRDELEAVIDLARAETSLNELVAARGHLERARVLALAEVGEHHPKLGKVLHDLGTVAYREGHYPEALAHLQRALAIRGEAFGPDSVDVATTIEAIGNVEVALDRPDDAHAHFAQAIALLEARLGPDHPDVADAYNDIGSTYHRAGDYQRALDNGLHVLAMRERKLGPDHPDVAQSLVNIAIEAKNLGRWDLVDANYPRAIAIYEKTSGPDSFAIAVTMINYGEARRVQGKLDEARAAYERARRILAKQLGEDHPLLAHVWNGLGELELARGQPALARPLLERAVAMREKDRMDATDLAESRFALARALPAAEHAHARELALAAQEVYRTAGPGYRSRLAAIETWLAATPPPSR